MHDEPLFVDPWGSAAYICCCAAFVLLSWAFVHWARGQFRRKPNPPQVSSLAEYSHLLASLETCPIQQKGLFWRLLKLYWKPLLFVVLMLCIPVVGWIILAICAAVWLLNYGNECTRLFDQEFQAFQEARRKPAKPLKTDHWAARAVWWGTKKTVKGTVKVGWWGTRKLAKGVWWLTRKGLEGAYLEVKDRCTPAEEPEKGRAGCAGVQPIRSGQSE